MKRTFLCLLALPALALAACESTPRPATPPAPPGNGKLIDAGDIRLGFIALDATQGSLNIALDSGLLETGSQMSLLIAQRLDQARNLLNLASAAQQAGDIVGASGLFWQADRVVQGVTGQLARYKQKHDAGAIQ